MFVSTVPMFLSTEPISDWIVWINSVRRLIFRFRLTN